DVVSVGVDNVPVFGWVEFSEGYLPVGICDLALRVVDNSLAVRSIHSAAALVRRHDSSAVNGNSGPVGYCEVQRASRCRQHMYRRCQFSRRDIIGSDANIPLVSTDCRGLWGIKE